MAKNRVPNAEWGHEWGHERYEGKKHGVPSIRWFCDLQGILGTLWTSQIRRCVDVRPIWTKLGRLESWFKMTSTLFQNGQNQRLNWIILHLLTLEFAQKVHLVAEIERFLWSWFFGRLTFLDRKILKTAYIAFLELGTPNRLQWGSNFVISYIEYVSI